MRGNPEQVRDRVSLRSWWQDAGRAGRLLNKVPEITIYFWVLKGLSTAVGESSSDYLVHTVSPVGAVGLGFTGFVVALGIQLSRRRYLPWAYWLAVVMVGIFGTMAADVLHVGLGVPYAASAVLYATALAAVFIGWYRTEHTLSIHSIVTTRREVFYWAAVVATFAMGTALGDLTGTALAHGYPLSVILYSLLIAVPAIGYWRFGWNGIFAFWFAYVMTRPLGASLADWAGKPSDHGGLGWGSGRVSVVLMITIAVLVAVLSRSRSGGRSIEAEGQVAPSAT